MVARPRIVSALEAGGTQLCRWLRRLPKRLPATARLIVITRADPALGPAALRARGELFELRASVRACLWCGSSVGSGSACIRCLRSSPSPGSLEFNLALRRRSLGLTLLSLRAIDRESER